MTTFADLLTLTAEISRRPELVSMTKAAIRAATLRAHLTDFFTRDAWVARLSYVAPSAVSYADVTDIYAAIPKLRAVKFVQCVNPATGAPSENLEYRDVNDTYDTKGVLRQNCYTLQGTVLRIYPFLMTGLIDVHCYTLPIVTEGGYNSWIANDFPEEIATWAASIVLHRTGALEQATQMLKLQVLPFKELLVESYQLPTVN